jgi:clorobiocin biosynthesis protein CloN4
VSLHELLITTAAERPDRVAITEPDRSFSYGELDRWANALAQRLRDAGVGRGDRVVLWADKSAAVVAAMQAVLRLGAAYVPVDGTTPVSRVAVTARDCAARVVCAAPDRAADVSAAVGPAIRCHELDGDPWPGPEPEPVNEPVAPDTLAYILYTSGSTGIPKGVCLSHRNGRAFVDWGVELLVPGPEDRFANHSALTFDMSVLDLYTAFAVGASVSLVPAELAYAPVQLAQFLYLNDISIWFSVPSALSLMMRHGGLLDRPAPPSLRAVMFGGEPFAIDELRSLARWTGARLVNLYGPTETNACTFHEVVSDDLTRGRPVPIGRAACGDRVWAERHDGALAQVGDEGELLVDGPTVMLGYWGDQRLTGPYRTGDIVRVLPDGSFDFIGRVDHLVKVRGHRVELGEVEAVLSAHEDIAQAAAVVVGAGMDTRLEAFVVPAGPRQPGVLALRQHCAKRLPRYMVCDRFHLVAELPLTSSGKVDRLALARSVSERSIASHASSPASEGT